MHGDFIIGYFRGYVEIWLTAFEVFFQSCRPILIRAQAESDVARVRYFDLYDIAPVGYCTLSEKGLILEANLTAATLLGTVRDKLVNQPIAWFIHKEHQNIYYLHRKKLFEANEPQEWEMRMVKQGGTVFDAHH